MFIDDRVSLNFLEIFCWFFTFWNASCKINPEKCPWWVLFYYNTSQPGHKNLLAYTQKALEWNMIIRLVVNLVDSLDFCQQQTKSFINVLIKNKPKANLQS